MEAPPSLCHPACPGVPWERTRISYYAAPKMTSFAAFIKESRMSFAEPIALPFVIPSAAEGSAVPRTFLGNVFRQSDEGVADARDRLDVARRGCRVAQGVAELLDRII